MNKPWLASYDPGVPSKLTYPNWSLYDLFEDSVENNPDFIAITLNDIEISYRGLKERVDAFAVGLNALGVQKGDHVALLLPNTPTYVVAFYAIVKLGAVVVNINVSTHGAELERMLNHSEATIVVTLDLFLKNLTDIIQQTKVEKIFIHSVFGIEKDIEGDDSIPPLFHVNNTIEQNKNSACFADSKPEDIAVLQYTSGVTGSPKAAILTHQSIVANVIQINSWYLKKSRDNSAVICIIPFFHVFGMTVSMHVSIYNGYNMVLFPQFDWSSIIPILESVRAHQPISFPAVPALWAALVFSSELQKVDLSSIEIASGGGAPLPISVQEKYYQLTGNYIAQAYGLSEASSTVLICPFRNGRISNSVGIPLPDTEVKIMEIENGEVECKTGEIGEIVFKGPQLMKGYWNDESLTKTAFKGDYFYTKDLGYMDTSGFFYLVDRKDDMILTRGYNVYPSNVEEILVKHPDIKEAVIVGVPDDLRGQSIKAFLVAESDNKPDRKELNAFCRQHLLEYQIPRSFKFCEEIPKNKIGKPIRRLLRESPT